MCGKYRVYWVEYDEDGNVISKGVDDREYTYQGNAFHRAHKLFKNKKIVYPWAEVKVSGFEYQVARRDPFVEYSHEAVCDICGCTYERSENVHGIDLGCRISMIHYNEAIRHKMCPDCADKINNYITKLKKGRKK